MQMKKTIGGYMKTIEEIREIISTLSLEEKASLCSGETFWLTKKIPGKDIPVIMVSDGPVGLRKQENVRKEIERLKTTGVTPEASKEFLEKYGSTPLPNKIPMYELLKRPEITYDNMAEIDPERLELTLHEKTEVEVQIKYEGYIQKQLDQVEKFKKLETKKLPDDLDYSTISGLRIEAQQKLNEIRPGSIGQASRISGVSPADINVLIIYLERARRLSKDK